MQICSFDHHELASQNGRAILFSHIPKTGGTTLTYLLKKGFGLTYFPLYKRYVKTSEYPYEPGTPAYFALQDYRDWARLRDHPTLHTAPDILIEGNVWGAENVIPFSLNGFYVTILRDPLAVFRSNYGYMVKHKHLVGIDLKTYMADHWAPNFITHHLGNGDRNLAVERLRTRFALFGVTEFYPDSVRLFAGFFGLAVADYTERNKSGSEQFDLSDSSVRRFWHLNRDDRYVYESAVGLFHERLQNAPFLEPGNGTAIKEHRTDLSYKANLNIEDAAPRIQAALETGDIPTAIGLIEAQEKIPIGDFLLLGNCYLKQNELQKAKRAYLEAFDWRASENIGSVLNFLYEHFPEELIDIVEHELDFLEWIIFDDPPDTFTYHDVVAYTDFLSSSYDKVGRRPDATALLRFETERMKQRGLVAGIGSHYDRTYQKLSERAEQYFGSLSPAEQRSIEKRGVGIANSRGGKDAAPAKAAANSFPRGKPGIAGFLRRFVQPRLPQTEPTGPNDADCTVPKDFRLPSFDAIRFPEMVADSAKTRPDR